MERSPFEPKPRDENAPDKLRQAPKDTPEEKADTDKQQQKRREQAKQKIEKERKKQQKQQAKQAEETDKKDKPPKKKIELSEEEKQERRENLVEQSVELVEEHEHEPAPHDPTALARLMLAHRVVNLQHQLKHPSGDTSALTPQEINATLDYIADLDEKFLDPDMETTPEIEQAYNEILQHVESSLERDAPPRKTPERQKTHMPDPQQAPPTKITPKNQTPSGSTPTTTPVADSNTTPSRREHSASDTRQRTTPTYRQPTPIRSTPERPPSTQRPTALAQGQLAAASLVAFAVAASRDKQPPKENPSDTPEQLVPPSDTHVETETPQHYEAADSLPPTPPAHTVERSVRQPTEVESTAPPMQDEAPALAPVAPPPTISQTSTHHEAMPSPTATFNTIRPPVERPLPKSLEIARPSQVDNTERKPKRKIEHLKLVEQLSIADPIYVGYGRYLRREFEAGHIDRSGLVKVLKAYTKGQDYQFEFRRQTERFTTLKATSPEFLRLSRHNNTTDTAQASEESQPDAHEPQSTENKQATPLLQWFPWSNRRNKRSNSPLASKKQSATKRLRRIILIVLVGLSLAALLIFLVYRTF